MKFSEQNFLASRSRAEKERHLKQGFRDKMHPTEHRIFQTALFVSKTTSLNLIRLPWHSRSRQ